MQTFLQQPVAWWDTKRLREARGDSVRASSGHGDRISTLRKNRTAVEIER